MMKIKELFEAYKKQISATSNVKLIFSQSGMCNQFAKLDFGFFPLGSGILTEQSKIDMAEIEEGGTMVLGNDFGTVSYFENKCKNKIENNSKTINNLKTIGLETESTFFTNFYLGLRDDKGYPGTTMTKLRICKKKDYEDFCSEYFINQLKSINPKVVICLGVDIGRTLPKIFSGFANSNNTLTSLYKNNETDKYAVCTNDNVFGKRKFVLIPHPSFAHINWKRHDIKSKIEEAIRSPWVNPDKFQS